MTKKKKKLFDTRFTILVASQLILLIPVIYLITLNKKEDSSQTALSSDYFRNLASKLHASGLEKEAIEYYKKYIQHAKAAPEVKAKVSYSVAQLYEKEGMYEKALAWYYQVGLLSKAAKENELANGRIVALLEKLKKFSAAKQALRDSTILEASKDKPKGAITVAKIGNDEIFLHEVTASIDTLPKDVRDSFSSPEGKMKLIQKYVANELMHRKALRLQYDKKPEFSKKLNDISKQLLIQTVLEEEIQQKITVDPSDLKNYFEANKEKYSQKERARISLIKVKKKGTATKIVQNLKKGESFAELAKKHSTDTSTKESGGVFNGEVVKGQPFMGHKIETTSSILSTKKDRWVGPVLSQGAYYIFLVREKLEASPANFEKQKPQVEFDYKMAKSQTLYNKLFEESMAQENVQFFFENVK